MDDITDALSVLEELMNVGPLTSELSHSLFLSPSLTHTHTYTGRSATTGGGAGHVTGTTEVDPKLQFPVERLLAYLEERHNLVGESECEQGL